MDVPAVVLAIVLAETAVGGLALMWLAPTWGALRHGYEILLGTTLVLMAWGAWASLRQPLGTVIGDPTSEASAVSAAQWAGDALLATTLLSAAAVVALVARQARVARILGVLAVAAGVASFVPIALLRDVRGGAGGLVQGLAELLLGAYLLGAIWDGLVLGHWYLVERRLSNRYMTWMAWVNVGAVVAGVGAVLLSVRSPVPCAGLTGRELELCAFTFSPLLSVGNLTVIMGLGVLALIALISGFNVKLAREGGRSIQAATGMFYLAVILAPAAEFAAKVRYF